MQVPKGKRTQTERREITRQSLLASARRLFGEQGYNSTSLEEIAEDSGLTIRPIYYHFSNKRGLFRAVNSAMELRTVRALASNSPVEAWEAFVSLCEDPAFRQILLIDAPNVLGRERWTTPYTLPCSSALAAEGPGDGANGEMRRELCTRVALAAFSEAGLAYVEADCDPAARREGMKLISKLLPQRQALPQNDPLSSALH
jgi:AcrR family transcriptional regulator